jgi:transposase-like protein
VVAAARKHDVSEQSLHRWRKKFAGMQVSDVTRSSPQAENRSLIGIAFGTEQGTP